MNKLHWLAILILAVGINCRASKLDDINTRLDDLETDQLFGLCGGMICPSQQIPLPPIPSGSVKNKLLGNDQSGILYLIVLKSIKSLSNGNIAFMLMTISPNGDIPRRMGNIIYFSSEQIIELNCSANSARVVSQRFYASDSDPRLLSSKVYSSKLEPITDSNSFFYLEKQYLCR